MEAPNLHIMWKDHKEDFMSKYQTRPVCDGTKGPLTRISDVLVRMVESLISGDTERKSGCRSTEEMLRSVEECNEKLSVEEEQKSFTLFSMDVHALYPSLDHEDVINCIEELVLRSNVKIEVKNKRELVKYIAVMVSEEEQSEKGLRESVPVRAVGGRDNLTVAYLDTETVRTKDGVKEKWSWEHWIEPTGEVLQRMIAIMMREIVRMCLTNHIYNVNGKLFK